MPDAPPDHPVLALIHEGWNHFKRRRPLAARASWLRALRIDPDSVPARDAIEFLTHAPDLPREARVEPKLRPPATESRRKAWDEVFRTKDLTDLGRVAEAFARLTEADPEDADAHYNRAIGLAWLGNNVEAVEALDQAVALEAWRDQARAIASWTLAELLRQGGGAEDIADDLTYTLRITGDEVSDFEFVRWLESLPQIEAATLPGIPPGADVSVWLDRVPGDGLLTDPADVPRILAYLVRTKSLLKLSSPEAVGMEPIREEVEARAGAECRREATSLPIPMLDAAVWAVRIPGDLPAEDQARLRRGAVERFYENLWVARDRIGLNGLTPLGAAEGAASDPRLTAKLAAVVNFREQLAERPSALDLYQGYPFDRLRRRLGLPLRDAENPGFDPDDVSCMSPSELDALSVETLSDSRLAEVFDSALPLGDDSRTARFATALVGRGPRALAAVDRNALFAVLIRRALADEGPAQALKLLDQAIEAEGAVNPGRESRVFTVWKAEVLARAKDPVAARDVYIELLGDDPDDVALPLEAAEMLLASGFPAEAKRFALIARERAEALGEGFVGRRARAILGEGDR